jgi:dihydrofolate reductase
MNDPKVSIIAALAENLAIGKNNRLLWRIPEDLKRFRRLTTGHAVVMGRKTFESIGRALPERKNIVISRDPDFKPENCLVASSFEDALEKAREIEKEEIFIIGGGQVYEQAIKQADKLYLTLVPGNYEADVFFPDYSSFRKIVYRRAFRWNDLNCSFSELEKN